MTINGKTGIHCIPVHFKMYNIINVLKHIAQCSRMPYKVHSSLQNIKQCRSSSLMIMHIAHFITMQGAEHHCISTGAALCLHYIAQCRTSAASLHCIRSCLMIAPCHSLQQNGLHLISPHHKHHHDTDRRNESAVFEDDRCDADDDCGANCSPFWQSLSNVGRFFAYFSMF